MNFRLTLSPVSGPESYLAYFYFDLNNFAVLQFPLHPALDITSFIQSKISQSLFKSSCKSGLEVGPKRVTALFCLSQFAVPEIDLSHDPQVII